MAPEQQKTQLSFSVPLSSPPSADGPLPPVLLRFGPNRSRGVAIQLAGEGLATQVSESGLSWVVRNYGRRKTLDGSLTHFGVPPSSPTLAELPPQDGWVQGAAIDDDGALTKEQLEFLRRKNRELDFELLEARIQQSDLPASLRDGRRICLLWDTLTTGDFQAHLLESRNAWPLSVQQLIKRGPLENRHIHDTERLGLTLDGDRKTRAQKFAARKDYIPQNDRATVGRLATVHELLGDSFGLTLGSCKPEELEGLSDFLIDFANGLFAFWGPQPSQRPNSSGLPSSLPKDEFPGLNAEPDSSDFIMLPELFLRSMLAWPSKAWEEIYLHSLAASEVCLMRYGSRTGPRTMESYYRKLGHRLKNHPLTADETRVIRDRYLQLRGNMGRAIALHGWLVWSAYRDQPNRPGWLMNGTLDRP